MSPVLSRETPQGFGDWRPLWEFGIILVCDLWAFSSVNLLLFVSSWIRSALTSRDVGQGHCLLGHLVFQVCQVHRLNKHASPCPLKPSVFCRVVVALCLLGCICYQYPVVTQSQIFLNHFYLLQGSSRAAAYNEKSGRITSLLFPKISAQIFPPWRKGNIEAKCLPPPQVLRCVTAWHWGPSACITKETASGAVGRQQPHWSLPLPTRCENLRTTALELILARRGDPLIVPLLSKCCMNRMEPTWS